MWLLPGQKQSENASCQDNWGNKKTYLAWTFYSDAISTLHTFLRSPNYTKKTVDWQKLVKNSLRPINWGCNKIRTAQIFFSLALRKL